MPGSDTVRFEVEDRIATITINRPEAMNALDPDTLAALADAWIEVRDNPGIWAAIVTGAGDRAFCAGADLKRTIGQRQAQAAWRIFESQAGANLDSGLEVWKPIVAAVNGYCLGAGLTLLSACDIRVASEQASFGLPEVRRGIVPTLGATQRLPRQLPWAIAMEVLLLGESISAERAQACGLINRVVPAAQVMPLAREYAQRFVDGAPLAIRAIKEAAVRGQSLPLAEGQRLEQLLAHAVSRTEDAREGPRAFAEKRPPIWTGR